MNTVDINDFRRIINAATEQLEIRSDEFSALDAKTGDGDHGTAIVAAFRAANEVIGQGTDLKQQLGDAGFAVMTKTSGSTSTLLGSLFLGLSDGVPSDTVDAKQLVHMFGCGLKSMQMQTKAAVGDKTTMDALIPAIEAMQTNLDGDVKNVFAAASEAALKGAEASIGMQAKFGRARNLKEKSIGFADAGATSMACIFKSFADNI